MTDSEKLITSARNYCISHFAFWMSKYSKEGSKNISSYSENDYNLFPRYHVIKAIQQGVEVFVEQEFSSFEICKQQLVDVGMKSHSVFTIEDNTQIYLLGESGKYLSTVSKKNTIQKNAMNEERLKFVEFIHSRTIENISHIKPIPYRHKLTDTEMITIRKQLLETWNYDGDYWNPLEDKSPKETVVILKENLTPDDSEKIINFLASISHKRMYEITEDRIDYEIEFDSFDLDLCETIVTDYSLDWVIYGSHEETLAFGGTKLIDFVKSLFATRADQLDTW